MKIFIFSIIATVFLLGMSASLSKIASERKVEIRVDLTACAEENTVCPYSVAFERNIDCLIIRDDSTRELNFFYIGSNHFLVSPPEVFIPVLLEFLSPIPQEKVEKFIDLSKFKKIEIDRSLENQEEEKPWNPQEEEKPWDNHERKWNI